MSALDLAPTWLSGDCDDPVETATLAEIAVFVDGEPIAQLEDPESGRISAGTRIPAYPLALGLAERWWRLLYEPEKPAARRVEARHRLDVPRLCLSSTGPLVGR